MDPLLMEKRLAIIKILLVRASERRYITYKELSEELSSQFDIHIHWRGFSVHLAEIGKLYEKSFRLPALVINKKKGYPGDGFFVEFHKEVDLKDTVKKRQVAKEEQAQVYKYIAQHGVKKTYRQYESKMNLL